MTNQRRADFRQTCLERDGNTCVVPSCTADADDVHHIIERAEWADGGYIPENGASVCNHHHRLAEDDIIPPQAFWRWLDLDGVTPDGIGQNVDKWGASLETPPHNELRDYYKYPSSRHLPFSHMNDDDDTAHRHVEKFLNIPVVVTEKMDGSNAILVADADAPVRSRSASRADHDSFDLLFQQYWEQNVYGKLPENLQIHGEWIYAKHSIHYGCSGCCEDRNQAPPLENGYFQVFGVYDTNWHLWLSWEATKQWADKLGFETTPVLFSNTEFDHEGEFYDKLSTLADKLTPNREGFVVRNTYPFHYGQFSERLGKFVRRDHVQTSEHWSHQRITENKTAGERDG